MNDLHHESCSQYSINIGMNAGVCGERIGYQQYLFKESTYGLTFRYLAFPCS
jgi:hypothetical protein